MIVVCGASGKTGSKAAETLLAKNRPVRVLGRSLDHLKWLGEKGAQIMTGDQADESFLTNAFSGADAVYLLVPPKLDADNPVKYYNVMGDVAISAIKKARIKKVVFLSSLGADLDAGTGPVLGLHDVERKLDTLKDVDMVFLRAGYFMENMLTNVGLIKAQKINGNTVTSRAPVQMVASRDVGLKAAELLDKAAFKGHSVLELFGHRISFEDATRIIGEKTGFPDLKYVQFTAQDSVTAMTGMGISTGVAAGFVEMSNSISQGKIATRKLDPEKPNAPTRFEKFVEDVLVPAFNVAA
jgi:uncharacterized protein YbjT (DUF2867 family)